MIFFISFLIFIINSKDIELLVPHCVVQQVLGTWDFSLTASDKSREQIFDECKPDTIFTPVEKLSITLTLPNIVSDDQGNKGTWTMIVDTGIEIRINNMRFLNFFQYKRSFWGKVTSFCNMTWSYHYYQEPTGNNLPPMKWGCWQGMKVNDTLEFARYNKTHVYYEKEKKKGPYSTGIQFEDFRIEAQQKNWEFFQNYKSFDKRVNDLPDHFDWRYDVNKTRFVPSIRDQAQCGSCYIFGTLGALDARVMIKTEGTQKPIYSEQDVIDCGKPTNLGCQGGLPFLVAEFGRSYGIVTNSDVHYRAMDGKCKDEKFEKFYIKDYNYVGGYYGASNADNMMLDIYNNGPITVSFYVTTEFFDYKLGVFHCGKLKPFEGLY